MTVLRNLVTSGLPYTGSGGTSRLGISRRRGIEESQSVGLAVRLGKRGRLRLRALGAVLRAALLAALDADGVEGAADDVIAHARQVLDAAAADEHQRVLLEVVTDTRDVGRHLDLVGQADAGHLAKRRVRLLRRLGEDADTDAA